MVEDQRDKLCARCRGIDFDHLFRDLADRELLEKDPAFVIDNPQECKSSSCPLCHFLMEMVPDGERDTCDSVSIFRACHTSRNGSTNRTPLDAPAMSERTALEVRTRTSEDELRLTIGTFVNYSKEPEAPVLIDHAKVSYEPLRTWCKVVQEIPRATMDVLPVSVIDCHKREIVPVRGPCDYVALSYVWGPTVSQGDATKGNSLPSHLPRTVEDAITVVRELGLRYLWVDRYCLDQSNKSEFQTQLNQMADIYRHALVTIIGAAGSDADYGLPGVSSRPRTKQPRVKIGDYTLWSSMNDPRKLVKESPWMTRAWTYQEGVFSWNWIAFTDEQVFFQRSNKEWANLERWWKVSCEMFPHGGLGADANCPLLQMYDNVWKNEGALHHLLKFYTARSLTYQSDILNGALGLLKRCENGPYRMNHYFGTPILGPLINHRKASGRDPSRSWTLTEAFLVNLCWRTPAAGPRRPGFPSWSWTGWQTVYQTPGQSLVYLGLSMNSVTDVKLSVQTSQGLVDWEAMCNNKNWDVYEDLGSLSQELYIGAPTIALKVCKDPRVSNGAMSGHAADPSPMRWCAIFSDEECDALIEVNLVDVAVESALLKSGTIPLKGILLRQVDPQQLMAKDYEWHANYIWAFALVVLESQDGATRVGSLELRPDNYFVCWKQDVHHSSAKPDKTWIQGDLKDYMDCTECRMKALEKLLLHWTAAKGYASPQLPDVSYIWCQQDSG
ncbi:2-polyprenyl-6-methoxyphenol hydroxylase [Ilyonectria robusta]